MRAAAPGVPAVRAVEALEQYDMPSLDKIVAVLNKVLQYWGLVIVELDKYFTPGAPFGGKLVSNTVGWVAVRTEDVLATRFLYPAR